VAVFLTEYDNLLSSSYNPANIFFSPDPSPHLQLDTDTGNEFSGTTRGGELSVTWVPADWWKLHGWYAFTEDHYSFHGEGFDSFEDVYGRISPQHQFFLRSSMDLPHNTELDVMARYVSELQALDIPDYFTVDVRLGWRPAENIELSLVGQNLIENRHLEAASDIVYGGAGAVARSCYLKLLVEF
jgi:iron complex outermembrane receptor protein